MRSRDGSAATRCSSANPPPKRGTLPVVVIHAFMKKPLGKLHATQTRSAVAILSVSVLASAIFVFFLAGYKARASIVFGREIFAHEVVRRFLRARLQDNKIFAPERPAARLILVLFVQIDAGWGWGV